MKAKIPDINLVQQSWTNNVLIPMTFKKFLRQGIILTTQIFFICALGILIYLAAYYVEGSHKGEILSMQKESSDLLQKYQGTQALIDEFERLSEWRSDLTLSEQFAALAWLFNEKKCFIAAATFHASLVGIQEKLSAEIRSNVERSAKLGMNTLKIIGVWDISLRIPVSGINTQAERNNIFTALQKGIADTFHSTTSANATLFTRETPSKNGADRLNVIVVIWNRRTS